MRTVHSPRSYRTAPAPCTLWEAAARTAAVTARAAWAAAAAWEVSSGAGAAAWAAAAEVVAAGWVVREELGAARCTHTRLLGGTHRVHLPLQASIQMRHKLRVARHYLRQGKGTVGRHFNCLLAGRKAVHALAIFSVAILTWQLVKEGFCGVVVADVDVLALHVSPVVLQQRKGKRATAQGGRGSRGTQSGMACLLTFPHKNPDP